VCGEGNDCARRSRGHAGLLLSKGRADGARAPASARDLDALRSLGFPGHQPVDRRPDPRRDSGDARGVSVRGARGVVRRTACRSCALRSDRSVDPVASAHPELGLSRAGQGNGGPGPDARAGRRGFRFHRFPAGGGRGGAGSGASGRALRRRQQRGGSPQWRVVCPLAEPRIRRLRSRLVLLPLPRRKGRAGRVVADRARRRQRPGLADQEHVEAGPAVEGHGGGGPRLGGQGCSRGHSRSILGPGGSCRPGSIRPSGARSSSEGFPLRWTSRAASA
jgi:hypothetical protein